MTNKEALAYVQGAISGYKREEKKWFKRGMKSAYEDCIAIIGGIGENEDFIIERIGQRLKELE